jgi:hypothetical protein
MYFSSFSVTMPVVCNRFFSETPARTNPVVCKKDSGNGMIVTTIALTQPSHLSVNIFTDWLNCNQSTEALISDIFEFGHDDLHRRLLRQVAEPVLAHWLRCAL